MPHSKIQVELDFILQAGTCQIINFAQNPRQCQSVQGTELKGREDTTQKNIYRDTVLDVYFYHSIMCLIPSIKGVITNTFHLPPASPPVSGFSDDIFGPRYQTRTETHVIFLNDILGEGRLTAIILCPHLSQSSFTLRRFRKLLQACKGIVKGVTITSEENH